MRHEHGEKAFTLARQLRTAPRSRAALASVCLHALLAATLVFAGRGGPPPGSPAPFVTATLIAALPPLPAPVRTEPVAAPESTPEPDATREPKARPGPPPTVPHEPAAAPESRVEAPEAPPAEAPAANAQASAAGEAPVAGAAPPPAAPDAPLVATDAPPGSSDVPSDPLVDAAELTPLPNDERPSVALAQAVDAAVRRRLASWTGRLALGGTSEALEWRSGGQTYRAQMTRVPAADPMSMEQLAVAVTTERDGRRFATELRMTRIAFSNFAQFIDRWDPNVQIHDDVVDGRFHSNTEIRVSRAGGVRPVFNGRVTLAANNIRSDGTGFLNRRSMFPAGLEMSVRRIVMPARSAAVDLEALPPARVRHLERDATLRFEPEGSVHWTYRDDGTADRATLADEPLYLVGAEGVTLHVAGAVNGVALVYSQGHIVIDSHLIYANDPRAPGADDFLGLVAERSVEIAEPEVTGPGDLEVHASIYARTRFQVRSYRSRPSGTLRIVGSVTAGSVSATEPRYATKIEFDERLTTLRAPGFPLSDRYELDSWSGEWRALPSD